MIRRALFLALILFSCSVAEAIGESDTTYVILVRHAEKQTGSDPSLSEAGVARAMTLRDHLVQSNVDVLVASQFKRTSETLQPLADATGLEIIVRPIDPANPHQSARETVLELVGEFSGKRIVIAGHSNTVPAMAGALINQDLDDLNERDYDKLYVIVVPAEGDTRLTRMNYGEPDDID